MVIPWLKCVLEIFRIRKNTKQPDFQCQNSEAPTILKRKNFDFNLPKFMKVASHILWPENMYHFSSDPLAPGRFGTSLAESQGLINPGRWFITSWLMIKLNHWLDDWMIGHWAGNKKRLHCRTISIEANTLPLPKRTFQSDIWCLAKRACEFGVLCSEFGLRQATTCYHKHVAKGQETQQIITNRWFCTQMW